MTDSLTGRQAPIRYPDIASPTLMSRRAWLLILLGVLLPGSPQTLAGNRKLGRFALTVTLCAWIAALLAVVLWFAARSVAYFLVTNAIVLTLVQVVLVGLAVLWFVLGIDTLRLAQLSFTSRRGRPLIALFAIVAVVATSGVGGWAAWITGSARSALLSVFSGGSIAEPIDGRYNILLLGGDAGPDRMGLRPDSISVVSIDAATGATTIIGIPRNLQRVPFADDSPLHEVFPTGYDCGDECLVSFLYTYGEEHPELYPGALRRGSEPGIEAMRDAAASVTGLTLQYYVLIDMQGFSDLIDALGGVTVTVTERLPIEGGEDANGQPINVEGWIEPGVQTMDGYTALWYSRSRHGTSDYDRMARQRQVQAAILAQFEPANVLTKFEAVANAGSQVVHTDIPQAMLGKFVELAGLARQQELARLELVPPTVNVVYPDFAGIRQLVASALLSPTSAPTPTAVP